MPNLERYYLKGEAYKYLNSLIYKYLPNAATQTNTLVILYSSEIKYWCIVFKSKE